VATDTARSITELAQTRFATGRGGTIFLVGGTGAGQGLVFDRLSPLLAQQPQPPMLLRGAIIDGTYVAGSTQSEPWRGVVSTAVELTASLAAFSGPLGALLGQIIGSMSDAQRFFRELSREQTSAPSGPRLLQRAIRALADQCPLCFAVESATPVAALWWLNLIEGLAAEAEVDLRLLTILGVEAPSTLPSQDDCDPPLWRLARLLVGGGRAEWWSMPVIDEATVDTLIEPCAPDLREKLCAIAGGQAGWVVELFAEWRRRGVIVEDRRGLWTFDHAKLAGGLAATNEIVDTRIREVLGEDPSSFGKSKRLLALGALQGETFQLEPIAELLGVELTTCEGLATELTRGEAPKALLEPASELPLEMPDRAVSHTSRFRFTDRLIWFSLTRYGLSVLERRDAARRSAAFLERTHTSDPASIAGILASLHAFADDHVESRRWRSIANLSPAGDLLRWQVKAAIDDEQQWGDWSREQAHRTARFLLNAFVQLSRVRPWDELCSFLEAVERLASIHDLRTEQCAAMRLQGKVYAASGDYEHARTRLNAAERILGPAGDRRERRGLLSELAYLDKLEGNLPRSLERLDAVIREARAADDKPAEAAAREARGKAALEAGDARRAQQELASAVDLYSELDDKDGLSSSLTEMGALQVVQGDVDGAIGSLREALTLAQNTCNKARELFARKHLGALLDDPVVAYRESERALVLARELNYAHAEADSLLSLARAALALRLWDDAGRFLQEGFDLQNRLSEPVGAAWFLREIGVLQTHIGALPQARRNLKIALRSFAAQDAQDGIAATHHALGNLAARKGDRHDAQREFALATRSGFPSSTGGRVIQVIHQTRPQRSWHPEA
jgi:tetratricopeptide (TPR) repeat protein